eukprot:304062-Chlamydomonas_euryale.AAC.7
MSVKTTLDFTFCADSTGVATVRKSGSSIANSSLASAASSVGGSARHNEKSCPDCCGDVTRNAIGAWRPAASRRHG